jgi:hypothetical protein
MYEYGIRVWGRRWDEQGNLVEDFQLIESDRGFGVLPVYRSAYEKAGLDGPPRSVPE